MKGIYDMNKIGIVTFHRALNYGAVMQTYALQNFLSDMGYDTKVIDYKCPFIEKCYSPFFVSDGKYFNAIIRGILFGGMIVKKRKKFERFLKNYIDLSKTYHDSDEMKKDRQNYSYFISGSDQVWSPISAGFDEFYFLPFAEDRQKLSYAASIGSTKLDADTKEELYRRIKGFSVLSVREESAKQLLLGADSKRTIEVHPDPTLLLEREEWLKIADKPSVEDKYVLLFNVEKPVNDIVFAKKLASKRKLKVVYINDRTVKKDPEITYIEAPSPNEFLGLFANAEIVVTNSFHGTVFSVIFQKEFYVELENKKQRNIRIEGLLSQLMIPSRDIAQENINFEIDWKNTEKILYEKRNIVKKFISDYMGSNQE